MIVSKILMGMKPTAGLYAFPIQKTAGAHSIQYSKRWSQSAQLSQFGRLADLSSRSFSTEAQGKASSEEPKEKAEANGTASEDQAGEEKKEEENKPPTEGEEPVVALEERKGIKNWIADHPFLTVFGCWLAYRVFEYEKSCRIESNYIEYRKDLNLDHPDHEPSAYKDPLIGTINLLRIAIAEIYNLFASQPIKPYRYHSFQELSDSILSSLSWSKENSSSDPIAN